MSEPALETYAEKRALVASRYEGFGVSIPEIKRTIAELLSLIGRDGIFSQYSKHDISHIDEVLRIAEWLVDEETKKILTDADWFLITLSIYFHDLGMLVTKSEFHDREASGFREFCENVLFSGKKAAEYMARVDELSPVDREIFLYEEFVRFNHAKRIRQWIEGKTGIQLGSAERAASEVQRILTNLDPTLRRDLALIAESHHLDDLDDLAKYKLLQPYGSRDAETANVQYCAIILRAADLLHMRRDRTPSVLFRVINPTDPISQREWAKQNAVRRVMPRMGLNDDNVPDERAPKDTIEVHARFTEENGFFGLTSFLSYVAQELRKCSDWAEQSKKQQGSKYSFVWRRIADDLIETDGFLKKTYSFNLDQDKILDLLIGHTLYNDTGVVLRELSQNGLDAIRLQQHDESRGPTQKTDGHLKVNWNSRDRILTVSDNGTGMTQDVIEKHLLKVGSSRYQDQKFKEDYPNFSAISRFGIGVLSTFMVSDEVEITTCSPLEEKARKISLRSVHGRYLVRLLDKDQDEEASSLAPHGTRLKLKIRSTARLGSVLEIVKQWIVIPRCKVSVTIDDARPVEVGFKSTSDAIQQYLTEAGANFEGTKPDYKIITKSVDGVEFSYAARWSSYFKDWTIASPLAQPTNSTVPCTCVEGIAVVFTSPGMNSRNLIAVANASGINAPKTNVARSTLEATPERDKLYSLIYGLYVGHAKEEMSRLTTEDDYSLTWAANNAMTLIPFGLRGGNNPEVVLPDELRDHMKRLPIYIVEKDGKRTNIDFEGLMKETPFWTVDSQLVRSAEQLVKEAKSNSNVSDVVLALGDQGQALPLGTILYNLDVSHSLRETVEAECEPSEIRTSEALRRVEVQWARRKAKHWIRLEDIFKRPTEFRRDRRYMRLLEYLEQRNRTDLIRVNGENTVGVDRVWLSPDDVTFTGINADCGSVVAHSRVFVRGDIPMTSFLRKIAEHCDDNPESIGQLQVFAWAFSICSNLSQSQATTYAGSLLRHIESDVGADFTKGTDDFLLALTNSPLNKFDISRWRNRS